MSLGSVNSISRETSAAHLPHGRASCKRPQERFCFVVKPSKQTFTSAYFCTLLNRLHAALIKNSKIPKASFFLLTYSILLRCIGGIKAKRL
ncbi:hypothetical protein TNCV_1746931 [Trichonephila clavipes]|nr:hypothetical protein TNCV_1746931 [Trichonephila clavipes]